MNCSEALSMVSPYVCRELSMQDTEDFLNHIEECQSCRDELETYFIVYKAIENLDAETETDTAMNFKKLLDQDLKHERHRIMLWRVRRILLILGILASIALIAFGTFLLLT